LALAAATSDIGATDYATITFDNTDNMGNTTNPNATTGGLLWIDTGGGPALANNDVNLQLLGGTSPTSLSVCPLAADGTPPPSNTTLLLSDGTANGDVTAFGDGVFIDNTCQTYDVPGSAYEGMYYFQLFAWSGMYDTYAAAFAASAAGVPGVYVARTPVFQNPAGGYIDASHSVPPSLPPDLVDMPAMVMRAVLPGDANLDGRVDINDLTIVLANYGQTGMTWAQGEFTGDGTVDINDLTIVLAHYGNSDSVGAMASVPEPGALALLAAGLLGPLAVAWRKRK
jgi:hypothetical protein